MFDHTFLTLQIIKSDITWAVSLVIAYGHFTLHQAFVWVCMATVDILTLSSTRIMMKLSDIIKTLKLHETFFVCFGFVSHCYNVTIVAVYKMCEIHAYVTFTPGSYHIECVF